MYNINYIISPMPAFARSQLLENAKKEEIINNARIAFEKAIEERNKIKIEEAAQNNDVYEAYKRAQSQLEYCKSAYYGALKLKPKKITNNISAFYYKFLNSHDKLQELKEEYLKKYGTESDTYFLALKESLDHYISYMLENKEGFSNTQEFKNYLAYIMEIAEEQETHGIHLEYSTNVVFDYIPEEVLGNKAKQIKEEREKTNRYINELMQELRKNTIDDKSKIIFLAKYFDSKRDLEDKNYEEFFRYVFNNLENLQCSPELISAILSYLPKVYGEGIENYSRTFLGKYSNKEELETAASCPMGGFTEFNINKFCNISLSSFDSLQKSRTLKNFDIMFLVFSQFHELTHQKQDLLLSEGVDWNGFAKELTDKVRTKANYSVNHDSEETEIHADQRAWQKLSIFSYKYLAKYNNVGWISNQCLVNQRAVGGRRSFSRKVEYDEFKIKFQQIVYDSMDLKNTCLGDLNFKNFNLGKADLHQILDNIYLKSGSSDNIIVQIKEQMEYSILIKISDSEILNKYLSGEEIDKQSEKKILDQFTEIEKQINEQIDVSKFSKQFLEQFNKLMEQNYPVFRAKTINNCITTYYMDFDLKKFQELIIEEYKNNYKKNEEYSSKILSNTDYLGMLFNYDGTIKLDIMYKSIINSSIGIEIANYILNEVPIEDIKTMISSGTMTKQDIERFMHNFETTIQGNTSKVGFFRMSSDETYDETEPNIDITSRQKELYDYYINLADKQINIFNDLKSYISELDLDKIFRPIDPSTINNRTSNVSTELKNKSKTRVNNDQTKKEQIQ